MKAIDFKEFQVAGAGGAGAGGAAAAIGPYLKADRRAVPNWMITSLDTFHSL